MSSYRIFLSNDLNRFIEEYGRKFRNSSFFHQDFPLIIQNSNLAEWLKLALCRQSGLSADFNFTFPEIAVRELLKNFDSVKDLCGEEEISLLFMDDMKVLIYKELEMILTGKRDFPEFQPLFNYLDSFAFQNGNIPENVLYQVSDAIAGMFYHYIMNCPEMILCWEQGNPLPSLPDRFLLHEKWQRILWMRLFQDGGFFHINRVVNHIIECNDSFNGNFDRLLLFGSSFMGDTSLRFFRYLSRFVDIDHFLLSPSPRLFDLKSSLENPVLKKSALLINGFSHLANSLGIEDLTDLSRAGAGDTVLGQIKNAILNNSPVFEKEFDPEHSDDSFQVLSCPGKMRETEIIRDKIIKLLDRDQTLDLVDIGILAPDINQYAPYIETLFSSVDESGKRADDHLPVNIIDLPGGLESPFIEGLLSLFELSGSRFSLRQILKLLRNPCFREKNRLSQTECALWEEELQVLHVSWGMDKTHRDGFVKNSDYRNSWNIAFDRLLEGSCLDEGDSELFPFESLNDSEIESHARLVRLVRSLYADCFGVNKAKMSLKSWVYLAESLMESYLAGRNGNRDDDRDRLRVKGVIRDIQNLESGLDSFSHYPDRLFSFTFFTTLFREALSKGGKKRGRYLTQGISCASIKPLRAVPFRVLFIMGLNESVFPGKENIASFDLREHVEKGIDLSVENSDRYSFMEALLSAEDKLILSYTGIDPIDGSERYPSLLINELFDFIDVNIAGKEKVLASHLFTQQYSLQSWAPSCFQEDEKQSCSPLHYTEFLIRSGRSQFPEIKPELTLFEGESTTIKHEGISLDELVAYYKNPLRWYANKSLGIYLENQEEPGREQADIDPVDPEFLERYSFFSSYVSQLPEAGTSGGENLLIRDQQTRGILSETYLGQWTREQWVHSLEAIRKNAGDIAGNRWKEQASILFAPSGDSFPLVALSEEGREKINVQGASGPFYSDGEESLLLIRYVAASALRYKHLIEPYFSALALKQVFPEKNILVYMTGERFSGKYYSLEPPAESSALLGKAVSGLFWGSKSPFPLYPDLMGDFPKGFFEIKDGFYKAWAADVGNSYENGSHALRDCPYRARFFPNKPEWNERQFQFMLDAVYRPLNQFWQDKGDTI